MSQCDSAQPKLNSRAHQDILECGSFSITYLSIYFLTVVQIYVSKVAIIFVTAAISLMETVRVLVSSQSMFTQAETLGS